jgi:Plasma-membrane choline transporter
MKVASKKESSNVVIEPLMISLPPLDDDSRKMPIQVDEKYVVVGLEQNSDGHTAIPVKAMQISQVSHDEQDENPYGISRYHRYHHLQQQEQQQDDSRSSTCRDPIWAVLFILQIVVLMCLGLTWGFQSITSNDTSSPSSWISDTSEFVSDFTILLIAIFVFAALLSSLASMILSRWPEELIKGFIILKIVVFLLFSIFWVTQEKQGGFLFFLIVAVWWVFYARAIWSMIPWVASNLTTGIAAISHNLGIYLVGLGVSLMTVPFTMIWLMAVTGTEWHTTSCSTDGTCENSGFGFILALFALSLFWTAQVLKVG